MTAINSGTNRWLAILLGMMLAVGITPAASVFADDTDKPIVAEKGETVVHDGNVTVQGPDDHYAVITDNGANVTVNGDVTNEMSGTRTKGAGVQAGNGSTVNINGSVTANGTDEGSEGIIANNGSKVTSGDVRTEGYKSSGVFASDAQISSGNVTTTSDEAYGAEAIGDESRVTVKNIVTMGRDSHGINSGVGALITADGVTTTGRYSSGILVNNMSNGASAIVKGDVITRGEEATGIQTYTDGKVRVAGNVSSEKSYGILINLSSKAVGQYRPTIVIEGTLSGGKAPIAIVPDYYYTRDEQGFLTSTGVLDYDLNDYLLPTIIVKNMNKGEQWISAVIEAEDKATGLSYYRELGTEADALINAILKNVLYITEGGQDVTVEIGGQKYTYHAAREGDTVVIDGQNYTLQRGGQKALAGPVNPTGTKDTTNVYTGTSAEAGKASAVITAASVSPETGDSDNMFIWIVMLAAAAAAAGGLLVYRRRG